MKRRGPNAPGLPEALEILGRPRTAGMLVTPWVSAVGREPPVISPTPPALGSRAVGWGPYGGNRYLFSDGLELPEIPGDSQPEWDAYIDAFPGLSPAQRGLCKAAYAASHRPDPPVPDPGP